MSGGIDSQHHGGLRPRRRRRQRAADGQRPAVFDRLIPDDEERFSSLVAQHLGIDLQLRPMDDQAYDPDWAQPTDPHGRADHRHRQRPSRAS